MAKKVLVFLEVFFSLDNLLVKNGLGPGPYWAFITLQNIKMEEILDLAGHDINF